MYLFKYHVHLTCGFFTLQW